MNYGFCRGCNAQILWVKTVNGRNMPCDPVIKPYWENKQGKENIVTTDGRTVRADTEGHEEKPSGLGYTSHFATCPHSSRFKRAH